MPKVTKEDVRLEGDVLKCVDEGVEHSVRYLIAQHRELFEAEAAHDAAHDAVIATVARIRDWMALERDTGKDLDGLLDAILKDAGEVSRG